MTFLIICDILIQKRKNIQHILLISHAHPKYPTKKNTQKLENTHIQTKHAKIHIHSDPLNNKIYNLKFKLYRLKYSIYYFNLYNLNFKLYILLLRGSECMCILARLNRRYTS